MSYTSFGEFVRILRIKHHEVMGDMAKVLGVKIPFLSAVENGKKNVPSDWVDKIAVHYGLSSSEQKQLQKSVDESRTQYKIIVGNAGIHQRKAALQFARSFDEMDYETATNNLEHISKKEENNS